MGNRRVIFVLLCGIALCAAGLWALQRHGRFFAAEEPARVSLFSHALDGVERVTVERGDARIGLVRREGRWVMEAPFAAQVEQGTVTRLLDGFESVRVKDVLRFSELRRRELSLKEFGLSPAQAHVVLEGSHGRDAFQFGAVSPLGDDVYLRMNGLEQVLVVPVSLYEALPRTADDVRSRKVLGGDSASLRTIEIRAPGKPFIRLSKESGTWRLAQPVAAPASDVKVKALIDALYEARVAHFVWPTVSNVMDAAEPEAAFRTRTEVYGLGAETGLQVQVQAGAAAAPSRVVFGLPLADAEGLSYALLRGGDAVGAVSNSVVAALQVSPGDLRDTRLFFERPSGIRRFQVYFRDVLFVLTQTNGVWRIESPVSDQADQAVASDTVERLLRLNAERVDDDSASEVRRVQDEQSLPISHVEVFSDQASYRFAISPDDIEGRFLRVSFTNSPTVFHVASSNVPPALVSMVGLLGLRDKTVLALPAASMRRLTFRRQGGVDEVAERVNGDKVWRFAEERAGLLTAERTGQVVQRLERLTAERVEKLGVLPEELEAYGFKTPWLEITVDVDADDAIRKTLLIGRDAGFGKRYAVVRGLDVVFVLGEEALRALGGPLVEAQE